MVDLAGLGVSYVDRIDRLWSKLYCIIYCGFIIPRAGDRRREIMYV